MPEGPAHESESLRRDIVDELDDHLSSAMQRELRRTDDEAQAEEAVLERFGDPRKVARQLWWDAMKEKIMRDRILMVALAVITLASLLVSLAVLRAVRDGQEVNQAMLARIAELSVQPTTTNKLTGDWSQAVVRVVSDGDAKPMEGVTVQLKGHIFNATDVGELSAKSDKEGIARIGPIKAGQYEFMAWANGHVAQYSNFAFYPGQTNEFTVIAPGPERASGQVKFNITCPDSLDQTDLLMRIEPIRADTKSLGSWNWRPPNPQYVYASINGHISKRWNSKLWQFQADPSLEDLRTIALPPGDYQIQSWQLFAIEPDQRNGKARGFISVDYTSTSYSGFVPIKFTVRADEEAQIKLDLVQEDNRRSYMRKSLQERREEAIKEFLKKKAN